MDKNILLDSKQLLFFKRTAELQHMTRAAEDLNVSQPFLSNSIASLESALGVELFDHKGRGIVLNDYGQAFYQHVVRIFNESESAIKELEEMKTGKTTSLSIGTNCALYMPRLFKYVKENIPDLNIHMVSIRRNKLFKLLTEGRIDFAISTPGYFENKDLVNIPLLKEKVTIIHAEDHWLKDYSQYPLKDLMNESFISVAPGYATHDQSQKLLEMNGIHLNVTVSTTETSNTFAFVKQGLGLAIVPLTAAMDDPYFRYNHTMISDLGIEGTVYLIHRKNYYMSETSSQFVELARQHFFLYEKQYSH